MYIFKELETFSVVALNDVEHGNNQRQTLLQIYLVLLLDQVTDLEQRSRSDVPYFEDACLFAYRWSLFKIWSLK
jgi:hypothetical protein